MSTRATAIFLLFSHVSLPACSTCLACCTVHTVMCYRGSLQLQLHDHLPPSPSRTPRHGYMATPTTNVLCLGLTTGTLRDGVSFIGRGTFNYVLMTSTVLIYACMYTKTPIACFLFRLKNPDTKTPHTCLSQPHGGCLRLHACPGMYCHLRNRVRG
jgi:hypothetical protein